MVHDAQGEAHPIFALLTTEANALAAAISCANPSRPLALLLSEMQWFRMLNPFPYFV